MEQQNSSENPKVISQVDVTKHDRLAVIKSFLKKRPPKKRLAIVAGVSVGVLLMGAIGAFTLIKDDSKPVIEPTVESTYVPPAEKIYSPLTGIETTPELASRPVTGIMIENSIDARPQSGLQEAGVVFEAIAEGGITRFLALFQEAQPENIGPIRSARPYFVQWAAGFDAAYVHSGGSGEALALIRALGVKDLDHGAFGNQIASRVSNRYAPHNVYTSMNRIDEVRIAQGYTKSEFTPLVRVSDEEEKVVKAETPEGAPAEDPAPAPAVTAGNISFNISSFLYNTSYSYNAESNNYQRVMGNQPHTDERSGKQIAPSVVVALIANYSIHPNRIHSVYGSIGTGKAIVFQNGQVAEVTWQKPDQTSPLTFKDASGADVDFERGQMWITAIPDGRVSYTP